MRWRCVYESNRSQLLAHLPPVRWHILRVSDGNADFKIANGVQYFQSLSHVHEIRRVVHVEERTPEFCGLKITASVCLTQAFEDQEASGNLQKNEMMRAQTLRSLRCQCGSHSLPAASMQSSTALARSGLMLRIFSSAFGARFWKLSQASNRIAAGAVDPGRKTLMEEAGTF